MVKYYDNKVYEQENYFQPDASRHSFVWRKEDRLLMIKGQKGVGKTTLVSG